MIHAHLSGHLVRTPESKTSSKGKPYVTALLVCPAGDSEQLINLTVFDDALQTLLANLAKGDSLSAMGTLSVRPWSNASGEPQAGLSLLANRIIALVDKQAQSRADTNRPRRAAGYQPTSQQQHARSAEFQTTAPPEFNDDLPDF